MYKLTALTKLILAIMISIASLITNDLYILSNISPYRSFYLFLFTLRQSYFGALLVF